jgi:hypothetical protein
MFRQASRNAIELCQVIQFAERQLAIAFEGGDASDIALRFGHRLTVV